MVGHTNAKQIDKVIKVNYLKRELDGNEKNKNFFGNR